MEAIRTAASLALLENVPLNLYKYKYIFRVLSREKYLNMFVLHYGKRKDGSPRNYKIN